MNERTIMQVVSDIRRQCQTVELAILVDELVMLVAGLQSRVETRRRWRETKRVQRQSEDKKKEPKKNNILNINQGGSRGDLSKDKPTGEPLFEEFWAAYPRKIGKGEAKKAYKNALKRASHCEIMAGVKRYAASNPDPKFTKHPGPWLNADRWLDETKYNVVPMISQPRWFDVRYDYEQKHGKDEAFSVYMEDLKARGNES